MIINYWPGIRHKVKFRDGCIESILQKRSFFFWYDIYPYRFHFELRPDPAIIEEKPDQRIMIHFNPMVLSFHNGMGGNSGTLEIWDESSFDLKKRLMEIANDYAKSIKVVKHYNSELERQMGEL